MATVTEAIKESLIGTATEPQLSEGSRTEFLKHAHKGEDDEYHMTEQEFINAIAPASEDYVRIGLSASINTVHDGLTYPQRTAQDKTRTIRHPLQSRRSSSSRHSQPLRLVQLHQPPRETRRRIRDRLPSVRRPGHRLRQVR